jgi:hypothetical protein
MVKTLRKFNVYNSGNAAGSDVFEPLAYRSYVLPSATGLFVSDLRLSNSLLYEIFTVSPTNYYLAIYTPSLTINSIKL